MNHAENITAADADHSAAIVRLAAARSRVAQLEAAPGPAIWQLWAADAELRAAAEAADLAEGATVRARHVARCDAAGVDPNCPFAALDLID